MSASIQHIARRALRTAARSSRPPVREVVTDSDGNEKTRRRKLRRPSRHTADADAIAESRLQGAWA
ncbi:hypothetical protein C1I95_17650 [Micromonospora craterilacus]|uniref:Uncharacterized protein n=1 Tax=Micromonospora craterilacus TaxID=1655439 RepID=A0A2W2DX65_9ACTN|nr:hypothetical protein [Micromonospora craterilacus]PZG16496.1 hypothetical protein C1I95_17650 [Micromonospora craterilacus]